MFVALRCLIDVYLQQGGKRSYFVRLLIINRPLRVCRADCCGKNLNSGVNGKVLRVTRDFYAKAKSV